MIIKNSYPIRDFQKSNIISFHGTNDIDMTLTLSNDNSLCDLWNRHSHTDYKDPWCNNRIPRPTDQAHVRIHKYTYIWSKIIVNNLIKQINHSNFKSSKQYQVSIIQFSHQNNPDSKVHGTNMGPTWVLSAPGRPHVSLMNLAIWEILIDPCLQISGMNNSITHIRIIIRPYFCCIIIKTQDYI